MLPNDPLMLLSYINTKLRDEYPSLDALCEDMEEDRDSITSSLEAINYQYDQTLNRFI